MCEALDPYPGAAPGLHRAHDPPLTPKRVVGFRGGSNNVPFAWKTGRPKTAVCRPPHSLLTISCDLFLKISKASAIFVLFRVMESVLQHVWGWHVGPQWPVSRPPPPPADPARMECTYPNACRGCSSAEASDSSACQPPFKSGGCAIFLLRSR